MAELHALCTVQGADEHAVTEPVFAPHVQQVVVRKIDGVDDRNRGTAGFILPRIENLFDRAGPCTLARHKAAELHCRQRLPANLLQSAEELRDFADTCKRWQILAPCDRDVLCFAHRTHRFERCTGAPQHGEIDPGRALLARAKSLDLCHHCRRLPHVVLVDAHAEGVGGADHLVLAGNEGVLHSLLARRRHARVESGYRPTALVESLGQLLGAPPRCRVDDGSALLRIRQVLAQHVLQFVALLEHA